MISKQQTQLNTFHTDTTQFINSGKDATTNLSGAMTNTTTGGIAALNTARGSLTGTVMPSLTSSLNSFAALNGTLDGTLTSLSGTLDQADGLFDQLVDTLNQTKTTISSTQDSLRQVASDVATVRTDIATLDSSAAYQKIRDTLHLDDKGFGDFMGNPVTLTTKVVYATDNYGSAVTPFYTNLALWVGGFVLIAIYKLEVDREGIRRITATQAYLGRWLLLVTIGFLQAVIATIGDLVLGIQCEHPLLFILAVVDTIEPYKIYSSKAADRDAVRIWKSIDISFTNNTLTLSSRYKCRPITKIYERAKGLEAWVDIESIELSSDRKSLRIKFK